MHDPLASCFGAIHDAAALLARGAGLHATFMEHGDRLALREIGYEAGPTLAMDQLEFDPEFRMNDLANAASDLRIVLGQNGQPWEGERRLEVVPGRDAESTIRVFSGAQPLGAFEVRSGDGYALLTSRLFRVFDAIGSDLAKLRQRSDQVAREFRAIRIDRAARQVHLELATPQVFPLNFLGVYSRQEAALVWGWAGPAGGDAERQQVRALRDRMQRQGVLAFVQPNVWAEPAFARSLAQAAAVMIGARSVFSADDGQVVKFFALA